MTAALSALERDPSLRKRVAETHHVLGGIEVSLRAAGRDGEWQPAGEIFETGPIATDVHLVRLPALPPGAVQVRLKMARGDWRIDWAALASLGGRAPPHSIRPGAILGTTNNGRNRVTVTPGQTVVTLPGDSYDLTFELPEHPDRYERH